MKWAKKKPTEKRQEREREKEKDKKKQEIIKNNIIPVFSDINANYLV